MFLSIKISAREDSLKDPLFVTADPAYFNLRDGSGSKEIRLRKREAYPTTYCRRADDNTFELGYGQTSQDHHNEFLKIVVRNNGDISIERDAYCVLPLFYAYVDDELIVANQYTEVLQAIGRPRASRVGIQDLLAPFSYYSHPLVAEIKILGDRQRLQLKRRELTVTLPPHRAWRISDDAPSTDPQQFRAQFEHFLEHFTRTRLLDEHFVCEISGGLDSATLPLYLRRVYGPSAVPLLSSLLFPGNFSRTQHEKLRALAEATGAKLVAERIHPETDFPLSHMVIGHKYRPFYIQHSLQAVYSRHIDKLQDMGVTVLCNGIGGDEVFENINDEALSLSSGESERQRRRQDKIAPFLTHKFKEEYVASVPDEPDIAVPLHGRSMLGIQVVQSNLYIERGIWPVSPFANPALYTFCQGLPIQYRANKNMLRMYHQACRNPELIYNPSQNEDFRDVYIGALRSGVYDETFTRLTNHSVTADLGYVDIDRLLHTYAQYKKGNIPERSDTYLYKWLAAEINLQFTPHLSV